VRRALVAGALALSAGCGAPAASAPDLAKPVYWWSWTRGACGERHALDGAGTLWVQRGCEDAHPRLVPSGRATASQRAAIVDAFARLPEPSSEACPTPAHQFQIDAGGRVRTWELCDAAAPASLTGSFADVPRAFQGAGPR
jgi:hypothetical protein